MAQGVAVFSVQGQVELHNATMHITASNLHLAIYGQVRIDSPSTMRTKPSSSGHFSVSLAFLLVERVTWKLVSFETL